MADRDSRPHFMTRGPSGVTRKGGYLQVSFINVELSGRLQEEGDDVHSSRDGLKIFASNMEQERIIDGPSL